MSAVASRNKVTQKEIDEKFDTLQNTLRTIKSSKGDDLLTHLQNVFKVLILHYPDQALDKLEEVSYLLKNADTHKIEDFLKVSDTRTYRDVCNEMSAYIAQMKGVMGKKKAPVEGEEEDAGADEAPEEVPPVGLVNDLLADAQILQWAGIGFGQ